MTDKQWQKWLPWVAAAAAMTKWALNSPRFERVVL
jgi:hypothetical protein